MQRMRRNKRGDYRQLLCKFPHPRKVAVSAVKHLRQWYGMVTGILVLNFDPGKVVAG
jgi:hypothetical protein